MKLASTKEMRPRPAARKSGAVKTDRRPIPASANQRKAWLIATILTLLAASLLRLLYLDLKPSHHDEGVNGFFLTNLFRAGYYHYDPANYHGPTLYYFGLITTTLNALFYGKAGLSTFAIRLVPSIFGIGIIWVVWTWRTHLSSFGALAAALLLAASPGMVYFSRYFIHEIPFVFLTLALVATVMNYHETAQPRYLMLASASAALMFATKETCIISFAVLFLAWVCTRLYLRIRNGRGEPPFTLPPYLKVRIYTSKHGKERLGLAMAALLFVVISVLFYSSFFTNPHGVVDSLRAFQIWTHTGTQTNQYPEPWWRYFDWMAGGIEKGTKGSFLEVPVLLLGGLGILIALWKARSRFAVFTAFWALGITSAYSLVPYKTPWLIVNLILPLGIMAGYGLRQWYEGGGVRGMSAMLVLSAAVVGSTYQAIDLSFFHYDDNSAPYPYVYAHTSRQLLALVDEVESVAARNPAGRNTGIAIVSREYWPLPWYLRDYPQAIFWGQIVEKSEPILIASTEQTEEVQTKLGRLYRFYKAYDLRPGNALVLYLRRDIQP